MQVAFNKVINPAIHYSTYITCLTSCAMILDKGIRLENIASDLVTPGDILLRNGILLLLFLPLLLIVFIKAGTKHLECHILIHILASLILALDYNTCRIMRDTYGTVGLVDVLSSGASCTISIEPVIFRLEFNFDIIIDFRRSIDRSK